MGGLSNSNCMYQGVATLDCIFPLIATFVYWAFNFVGIVAAIFIIISGAKFITSGGDPKKVDSARRTFVFAIIGLLVVFLAFFFLNVLSNLTGVKCLNVTQSWGFNTCF